MFYSSFVHFCFSARIFVLCMIYIYAIFCTNPCTLTFDRCLWVNLFQMLLSWSPPCTSCGHTPWCPPVHRLHTSVSPSPIGNPLSTGSVPTDPGLLELRVTRASKRLKIQNEWNVPFSRLVCALQLAHLARAHHGHVIFPCTSRPSARDIRL